jgi:hypothetical protein
LGLEDHIRNGIRVGFWRQFLLWEFPITLEMFPIPEQASHGY